MIGHDASERDNFLYFIVFVHVMAKRCGWVLGDRLEHLISAKKLLASEFASKNSKLMQSRNSKPIPNIALENPFSLKHGDHTKTK